MNPTPKKTLKYHTCRKPAYLPRKTSPDTSQKKDKKEEPINPLQTFTQKKILHFSFELTFVLTFFIKIKGGNFIKNTWSNKFELLLTMHVGIDDNILGQFVM